MVGNVLIGVPEGVDSRFEQSLKAMVCKAMEPLSIKFVIVKTEEDFSAAIMQNQRYVLVLTMDNIGVGNEYSQFLVGRDNAEHYIVVVPNRCEGSGSLEELIDKEIYNILYEKDMRLSYIKKLIAKSRNRREAFEYCKVEYKPMTIQSTWNEVKEKENVSVEKNVQEIIKGDERVQKSEREEGRNNPTEIKMRDGNIQIRKVTDNITVTRLRASDAKLGEHADIGDSDVMRAFLGNVNTFDLQSIGSKVDVMTFPVEPEWVYEYRSKLNAYFKKEGLDVFQQYENGDLPKEDFEAIIMAQIKGYDLGENSEEKRIILYKSFIGATFSYGKLDPVFAKKDVTDVRLIDKDTVNVQHKGKWYSTNITFESKEEYERYIARICTKNKRSLNVQQAQIEFMDMDTFSDKRMRFEVTHSLLNTNGTSSAHIRVQMNKKKTATELIGDGYWTKEQAVFCANLMQLKKNILVCGGSGSGKTIGMNCLIEYADDNVCGICMQISDELHSDRKKNIEFQHTLAPQGENKVEYTLRQLTTSGLKKNAKLFIVGETKGDEARDVLTAGITGAQIVSSLHGNSVFDAIPRLSDLTMYKSVYTQEELMRTYARVIDYILYLEDFNMKQIAGVVGWDESRKEIIYDMYEFVS